MRISHYAMVWLALGSACAEKKSVEPKEMVPSRVESNRFEDYIGYLEAQDNIDRQVCRDSTKTQRDYAICYAESHRQTLVRAGADVRLQAQAGQVDSLRIDLYGLVDSNQMTKREADYRVGQLAMEIVAADEAEARRRAAAAAIYQLTSPTPSYPVATPTPPSKTKCKWVFDTWTCTQN